MSDITFASFSGGEVGPAYYGRTDQDAYYLSAKQLQNLIASISGAAVGRGGTVFLGKSRDMTEKVLLIPFMFNDEQAYICEFGDRTVRFYRDRERIYEGALVMTGASKASTAVITAAHDLRNGDGIRITGVLGMTQLNGNQYTVATITTGSPKSISAATDTNPVKVTLGSGHGFLGDTIVRLGSVGGMTEVNGRDFRLINVSYDNDAIIGISKASTAIVTTSGEHGIPHGSTVELTGVGGMSQVNNLRFTANRNIASTSVITGATKANPVVITTSGAHGLTTGEKVYISAIVGMTELNGREFTVAPKLGSAKAITWAFAANPVRIYSTAHGFSTGNRVRITGVTGMTALNSQEFTLTKINNDSYTLDGVNGAAYPTGNGGTATLITTTTFELLGENGTDHTAYSSGGTVGKMNVDKFELSGINSSAYTTYTSGGTAERVEADQFYLENEDGTVNGLYTTGGEATKILTSSFQLSGVNSTGYTTYSSAGTIERVFEIASPYGAEDLFDADGLPLLQIAQSADFLFIAHPDFAPRQLTRAGTTDWAVDLFLNDEGPFLDENLGSTTIYGLGNYTVGQTITLKASAPLWQAGHVGALWQLRLKDGATYPVWATATAYALGDEIVNGGLFYRCTDAGTSGTEAPTHNIGEAYDGGVVATNCKWKYIHNGRGVVEITGFTSNKEVTALVWTELPAGVFTATNATTRWNEGAWSDVQGWPRAVALHAGRLCWAGTAQQPLGIDFSNTESFFNYNPVEPDATVTRSTAFRRVLDSDNPIRWMRSTDAGLIVGTLNGIWNVSTESQTQGFGADTAVAETVAVGGSAAIQPVRNGDSLLYAQRARKRLRDIVLSDDQQQKLVTTDRNLRADHVLGQGLIAMAYCEEPHRITWCLLQDGTLAGLTYNREQGAQVSAWHRHTIGGAFSTGDAVVESITSIPSPDEATDDLYLSVKRTINGQTVRYTEYMAQPLGDLDDLADGIYPDSCHVYSGSPLTTVTGLGHLEGQTVQIIADGRACEDAVVTSGTVTLPFSASKVRVGLFKKRVLETMNIDVVSDKVNTKNRLKRIFNCMVEFVRSVGGWVGADEANMDRLVFDETTEDAAPILLTGIIEENISDGNDKRKSFRYEQRQPFPTTITSVTVRFDVGAAG